MTTQKIWIFDLDDTLHNASAHVFPVMHCAMTQYIMDHLALDERAAHQLRQHYWKIYGATLKGLVRHHGVNPHHFLDQTHTPLDLPNMVLETKRLRHTLQNLTGRKVVFTNAPLAYAMRVLNLLGLEDLFELVFSIESTHFHPKPAVRGYQKLLQKMRAKPSDCIMVEDSLANLMIAKRMGMTTVWVSKTLKKSNFVDFRIKNVLALTYLRV
ncbi:MAG: pyrimidine 5'-nucleotidase [Methylophilaceae bacterium]